MLSANLTCINSDYISNLPLLTPDAQTLLVAEVKTEQDTYISGRISLPQAIINAGINLTNTPVDAWITSNSSNIGAATSWFLANNIRIGRATNWVLTNSGNILNAATWLVANSGNIGSGSGNSSTNVSVTILDITQPTNVTHNLNTLNPIVQVLSNLGEQINVKINIVDANNLTILPIDNISNGAVVSVTIAGGTVQYDADNANITNFVTQNSATLLETANTVQNLTADEFLQNIITSWVDGNSGVITEAVNWIHILSAVREKHEDLENAVFAWVTAFSADLTDLLTYNLQAYTNWVVDNSSTLKFTYENIESVPSETESATTWVLQNSSNLEAVKLALNDTFTTTRANQSEISNLKSQIDTYTNIDNENQIKFDALSTSVENINNNLQDLKTTQNWWENNKNLIDSINTWAVNVSSTLISKAHLNTVEDLFKPIKTWVNQNSATLEGVASYIVNTDVNNKQLEKHTEEISKLSIQLASVFEKINNTTSVTPIIIDNIKDNGWLLANKEEIVNCIEWYNKNSKYIIDTLTNFNNASLNTINSDNKELAILSDNLNKKIEPLSEVSSWVKSTSSLIAASLLNSEWIRTNKAVIHDINTWITDNSSQIIDTNSQILDIKNVIDSLLLSNSDKVGVSEFKKIIEDITLELKNNSQAIGNINVLLNNSIYAYNWVDSNKGVVSELTADVDAAKRNIELLRSDITTITNNVNTWLTDNKSQLLEVKETTKQNSNVVEQINNTIANITASVKFVDNNFKSISDSVKEYKDQINALENTLKEFSEHSLDKNQEVDMSVFSEKIKKLDEAFIWLEQNKNNIENILNVKISEPLFKNWSIQNIDNINQAIEWVSANKNAVLQLQDHVNKTSNDLQTVNTFIKTNKELIDSLTIQISANASRIALTDKIEPLENIVKGLLVLKTQVSEIFQNIDLNKATEHTLKNLAESTQNSLVGIQNNIKDIENKLHEVSLNSDISTWVESNSSTILKVNALEKWLTDSTQQFVYKSDFADTLTAYYKNENIDKLTSNFNNDIQKLTDKINSISSWTLANSGIVASSIVATNWIGSVKDAIYNTINWVDNNKSVLAKIDENELKINNLKQTVDGFNTLVDRVREQEETSLRQFEDSTLSKVKELLSSVSYDKDIKSVSDELTSVKDFIKKINTTAEGVTSDINIIREKIQAASALISSNTSSTLVNKSKIEELFNSVNTIKDEMLYSGKTLNELVVVVDNLQGQLNNDNLKAVEGKIASLYVEINKLKNNLNNTVETKTEIINTIQHIDLLNDKEFLLLKDGVNKIEQSVAIDNKAIVNIASEINLIKNLINTYATQDWVLKQIPNIPDTASIEHSVTSTINRLNSIDLDIASKTDAINLLKSELVKITNLQDKIKDLESTFNVERVAFTKWVEGKIPNIDSVRATLDSYRSEIDLLTKSLNNVSNDKTLEELLNREINDIKDAIAKNNGAIILAKSELNSTIQSVRNDIADIKTHVSLIESQLLELNVKSGSTSEIDNSFCTELFVTKSEIDNINNNISSLEQRLTGLVIKVSSLKLETETVDLTHINNSISSVNERVSLLTQNINNIHIPQIDLSDVYTDLDTIKSQIVSIQSLTKNNEKFDPTNIYNNIQSIEQRLAGLVVKVSNIKEIEPTDLTSVFNTIDNLKEQLAYLSTKVNNIVIPVVDLTEINNEISAIKSIVANIASKTANIKDTETDIAIIKERLNKLSLKTDDIKPVEIDLTPLNADVACLKEQIAYITQRVSNITKPTDVDLTSITDITSELAQRLTKVETSVNNFKPERVDLTGINSDINFVKNQIADVYIKLSLVKPIEVDLTEVNTNISNLNITVEDISSKIQRLTTQINNVKPEAQDLSVIENEILSLKGVLTGLTVKVSSIKPAELSLADFNNTISLLSNDLTSLKNRVNNLDSAFNELNTTVKQEIFDKEIANIKTSIDDIVNKISLIKPTEVNLSGIDKEIVSLKNILTGLTVKVASIKPTEVDLSGVNTEITSLKNVLVEVINKVSSIKPTEVDLSGVNNEITSLKNILTGLTVKVASVKPTEVDLSGVNNEITSLKNILADLTAKVASIKPTEVDLSGVNTEINTLKNVLADLTARVSSIKPTEVDLSGVNNEITSLKNVLTGLTVKVASAKPTEVDLSGINTEITSLKNILADLTIKVASVKPTEVDLSGIDSEIASLKNILTGLTARVSSIKPTEVDLSDVNSEIENVKLALKQLAQQTSTNVYIDEISKVKSVINNYEQRITILASAVSNYIKNIQTEVSTLKNDTKIYADKETLNDILIDTTDKFTKFNSKIINIENNIEQLLTDVRNSLNYSTSVDEKVTNTINDLNDIKLLIENNNNTSTHQDIDISFYENQAIDFDNRIKKLDSKIETSINVLARLTLQLESSTKEPLSTISTPEKVCDCEALISKINDEVNELKDSINRYNAVFISKLQFNKTIIEFKEANDQIKVDIEHALNSISTLLEQNEKYNNEINLNKKDISELSDNLPVIHSTLNKHTGEISKLVEKISHNTDIVNSCAQKVQWYADAKDELETLLITHKNTNTNTTTTWVESNSAWIKQSASDNYNTLIKVTNLSTWIAANSSAVYKELEDVKNNINISDKRLDNIQEWLLTNSKILTELNGIVETFIEHSKNNSTWIESNEPNVLNASRWISQYSNLLLTKIDNLSELTHNFGEVEEFINNNKQEILHWHKWLGDNANIITQSAAWMQTLTSIKPQQNQKLQTLQITDEQADETFNWVLENSSTFSDIASWFNSVQDKLILYSSWLLNNVSTIINTITWVNNNSGAFAVTQSQMFKTLMYATSSNDWITYWGDTLITRSNWVTGNSASFESIKKGTEWFVTNKNTGAQALTWVVTNSSNVLETAQWVRLLSGARECHAELERQVFAWVMANSDIVWVESWIYNNSACIYDTCNWVKDNSAIFDQLVSYTDDTSAHFINVAGWVTQNSAYIEEVNEWVYANKTDLELLSSFYLPISTAVKQAADWVSLSSTRVEKTVDWTEKWAERAEWAVKWVEDWRDDVENTVTWSQSRSALYETAYTWVGDNSAVVENLVDNVDYLLSATAPSITYFEKFRDAYENLTTLSAAYLVDEEGSGGGDCEPCKWPFTRPINRPVGNLLVPGTKRNFVGDTAIQILSAILYGEDLRIVIHPDSYHVVPNQNVYFTGSAVGDEPITYQWYLSSSTIPLSTIEGATGTELPIISAKKYNEASYFFVASNQFATATSNVGVLEVWDPLEHTVNPQGFKAYVRTGSPIASTLSDTMTGSLPITYKWVHDGSPFSSETIIPVGNSRTVTSPFIAANVNNYTTLTGYYWVSAFNIVNQKDSLSALVQLIVPVDIYSNPTSYELEKDETVTLYSSASGTEPIVYQWYSVINNTTTLIEGATTNQLPNVYLDGTYYMRASNDIVNGVGLATDESAPAYITHRVSPVKITLQPQTSAIRDDHEHTMYAEASAENDNIISYQWYSRSGSTITRINGATNKTYTTNIGGTYFVVASGETTSTSATSNNAYVFIAYRPGFTVEPLSNTVTENTSHTFTTQATGTGPLTYTWYREGVAIPNSNSKDYTFIVRASDDGASYSAVVSGAGVFNSSSPSYTQVLHNTYNDLGIDESNAAVLTVIRNIMIVTNPQTSAVRLGNSHTFYVSATGNGDISYQWLNVTNNTPITIVGATTTSLVTSVSGIYRAEATDTRGLKAQSNTATLYTALTPVFTLTPQQSTVAPNTSVTFTSNATGSQVITYQWYRKRTTESDFTIRPGQINRNYQFNADELDDQATFMIVASGPRTWQPEAGASTFTMDGINELLSVSSTTLLDIKYVPVIVTNPSPSAVRDGNSHTFYVSATGDTPIAYQWYKGVYPGGTIVNSQTSTSLTTSVSGTYYAVASNRFGTANSQFAGLSTAFPVGFVSPFLASSKVVLAGATAGTFTIATSGTPTITYQWYKNDVKVAGAASTSYSPATQMTLQDDGTTFTVVASSPDSAFGYPMTGVNELGEVSATIAIDVVAGPMFVTHPTPSAIKLTNTHTFFASATGDPSGITYQWYKKEGAVETIIPGQTSTSLLTTVSGVYFAKATNVIGTISSNTAGLTTTEPVAFVTTPSNATNKLTGQNHTFTSTTRGTPTITYKWYRKNSDESVYTLIPNQTNSSYTITNIASSDDQATFMVVASSPDEYFSGITYPMTGINDLGEVSATATLDVIFPPLITENPVTSAVKLTNSHTFSVSASSDTTPITYQWYKGTPPNGTLVSGQTNRTLLTSVSGTYYATAANAAGTVTSNTANLSTAIPVSWTIQPQDVTALAGASVTFNSNAIGTETSSGIITYQWYRKNSGAAAFTIINGATSKSYTFTAANADDQATFMVVASAPDEAWSYPMTGTNELGTISSDAVFTLETIPQQNYILWGKYFGTPSTLGTAGGEPATNTRVIYTTANSIVNLSGANAYYANTTIPGVTDICRFPLGSSTSGMVAVKDYPELVYMMNNNNITFNSTGDPGNFNQVFYCSSVYFEPVDSYPASLDMGFPNTANVLDAQGSSKGFSTYIKTRSVTLTKNTNLSAIAAPYMIDALHYVFVPKGLPGNAWTAAYNVTLSKPEGVVGTAGVNPAVGQEVTITVNGTPTDYYIYRVVKSVNATVLRMTP